MNNATMVGKLGRDPEMRYFESGKCKTTISLAVPRKFKTKEKDVDWFTVEFWGKTAELVGELFKKGSKIAVQGAMATDDWTDKDGKKQTKVFLNATDFTFIDPKPTDGSERPAQQHGSKRQAVNELTDSIFNSEDEIPF